MKSGPVVTSEGAGRSLSREVGECRVATPKAATGHEQQQWHPTTLCARGVCVAVQVTRRLNRSRCSRWEYKARGVQPIWLYRARHVGQGCLRCALRACTGACTKSCQG